jgi:hypothetical protein
MDDLSQIKKLAGITPANSANMQPYDPLGGSNVSITGTEKSLIQREKNIQPGTEEWFRLWFSKPYLTGEKPTD